MVSVKVICSNFGEKIDRKLKETFYASDSISLHLNEVYETLCNYELLR